VSLNLLHEMNGKLCSCGKVHIFSAELYTGRGAVCNLPLIMANLGCQKAFLLSDRNTHKAAAEPVCSVLIKNSFSYTDYSFPYDQVEPDEKTVGSAVMHFDKTCDVIIGIGSGVINDVGKILSNLTGKPYIIVATAPSMDGYASATSSMTRDGLKISLPSRSADVIVGDTDILMDAPLHMMKSGLGDMLAKYISICEWRIANLITGEYYCEAVADLVRQALKRCVDHADGLLSRDQTAVEAVFEGLVIGGVAMNYAGLSRPASGVEHYISHVLDMRAVEFDTPMDLHGIQCAIGTLISAKLYEGLKTVVPNREQALSHAAAFDFAAWSEELRRYLGKGAESMIALEAKEGKYDLAKHRDRLEIILSNWQQILRIIDEEVPPASELEALLDRIDAPKTLPQIGIPEEELPMIFRCTKDIRDKYVLSRLAWDLGIAEQLL
jgi:glycerol-1-phosphate dehydrogenase [NAD(P)+]